MGAYFFGFFIETYSKGGLNIFLVVGHIPVEIFLLANYFLDFTYASNGIFFKGQANSL